MGVTHQAIAISIFVLCASFSVTAVNAILDQYETDQGRQLITFRQTSAFNNSDAGVPGDMAGWNQTVSDMSQNQAPQSQSVLDNINDWLSFSRLGILMDFMTFATFGFPQFLSSYFYMPSVFVVPMTLLINISHLLFIIYFITGRTF